MTDRAIGPVSFIGLGMMGLPMATRLLDAGHDMRGSDLSVEARAAFAAKGGSAFETARQAAEGAGFVITMLPDGGVVRQVLLGEGGIVGMLAPGALVIDMSSSDPLGTRSLAEELASRDIGFIDAPVSGGVKRAVDGDLAIMAGGDSSQIERARPLFSVIGRNVFETGPVGSGHAVKALNN